ncbi:MAG TPA: Gfo/Idh/MocA family oxidoreductase [Planctomycetota bacterium]|nr:Gfo/Idh/MocA family oxidoreductase [Planctomycetota bacterium]
MNPDHVKASGKIRYAVVGLGHIAQAAVLPAFEHASENSVLAALVSDDPIKLQELGTRYNVPNTYMYAQYDEMLRSGNVDAVYIALPNHLHRQYTERAARAGVHVLCEKPMAVTVPDCEAMIRAAREGNVKLMIAYRLHFEEANLSAIELCESGKLGDVKLFNSAFTMQVADRNIRLSREMGGGPIYDIGIYCINAARYIFRDEPTEVFAFLGNTGDPRFRDVEEQAAVCLYFPHGRVASFEVSFGAAPMARYDVIGTRGTLSMLQAYEYESPITQFVTIEGKSSAREFHKRDQFAPELIYFSNCILQNKEPEPDGYEGLADVRIIEGIFESARSTKSALIDPLQLRSRPSLAQQIKRPAVSEPELVHAFPPSKD